MGRKITKSWLKEWLNYFANSTSRNINACLECGDDEAATRFMGGLDVLRSLAEMADIELDIDRVDENV